MSLVINLLQSNIRAFISGLINSDKRLLNDVGYILDIQNGKIYYYWFGKYEKYTEPTILATLNFLRTNTQKSGGFLTITKVPDQIRNQIDVWVNHQSNLNIMKIFLNNTK